MALSGTSAAHPPIAARLAARLDAERLLPDEHRYRAAVALALSEGRALLERGIGGVDAERAVAAARALHLDAGDLERALGMGHAQASALARLVGLDEDDDTTAAMVRLGALFNLGISLFDLLHDRFPGRAATLSRQLDPTALAAVMQSGRAFTPTGDGAVDLLLGLIAAFFQGAASLPGRGEPRHQLARLIMAMHGGELASTRGRFEASPPSRAVLRQLRRKSALPLWTVAVLAQLARPEAPPSGPAPTRLRALVGCAADALWLVDDLVDLEEDHAAGVWSRPWWILGRRLGHPPPRDLAAALSCLDDDGIVEAEAGRLADRLRRLRDARERGAAALWLSIAVAVRSWLAGSW